jgi:nucleoside-diphosphate-sugar epimerase
LKNIFITGCSSYLGQNVIGQLEDYKFYGLVNRFNPPDFSNLTKLSYIPEDLKEFFIENDIRVIIHLASNSNRVEELKSFEDLLSSNINLGAKLLNSSVGTNVDLLISAGSYSQNINSERESLYTLTKNYFEKIQYIFSNKYGLNNVSFHLGDVYGPNDFRNKLIPYLLKNEEQDQINLNSDGYGLFSPVHIKDVVNHFRQSIEANPLKKFESKNLTSELLTVRDFISVYKNIRKKKFDVIYGDFSHSFSENTDEFEIIDNLAYPLEKGLLDL